jgi:TetR/AcrR family transcriptional regulator, transcriptional repressor for nem operon
MDTRTALLTSAERATRSRGYDGFSYADLSREVGIRKASIHHHFPTKADLALALVQRYRHGFFEALDEITTRFTTGRERMDAYIAAYRHGLSGGETICLCVAFSAGRDSLAEPVLSQLNGFNQDSIAWLTGVFQLGMSDGSIRDVKDPKAEAAACLALVEGGQLLARAAVDVSLFDAALKGLRQRIE